MTHITYPTTLVLQAVADDGLLFGVEPTDAVTYASVIVLMLVAALLACAIPAMRAARVNPLSAIRAE